MNRFLQLTVLTSILAAAMVAQQPAAEPETFLRKQLGVTTLELSGLEKGQVIVRLPKPIETREVAAFAIMRLDVPAEFFIEHVRDIVTFKKGDNVLQIAKFSNPPRIEDLAALTLEPGEIEDIRDCRVNSCNLKMSVEFIERFRKEINWSAPDYRDRVTRLMREMLLDYVQAYLKGGNSTLGQYNDKSSAVGLADELRPLLRPAPYLYEYVPAFQKYLEDFPGSQLPDTEDFFYWSKEKFGLKPFISLTHVTIYKRATPGGTDVLMASEGLYADHYFEASLGLTAFIQSQASTPSRSYGLYVNRSRIDALRGLLGGLKRTLISGSLRDGARKDMETIKQKLESEYRMK